MARRDERGLLSANKLVPTQPAGMNRRSKRADCPFAGPKESIASVDSDRMRNNLDITQGLIMAEAITFALAAKISRQEAHRLVEEACQKAIAEKRSLQNVLGEDPRVTTHLPGPVLGRLFEPMSYQGAAQTFIDRLVGSLRAGTSKRP